VGLVVLLGGGFAAQDDSAQASESSAVTAGVNLSAVPALARQMLPFLQQRRLSRTSWKLRWRSPA
jgi:hypothetical protein